MDMVAEQRAIDWCLEGRKEAFRPLVDAYFARAVRLARAIVGPGDAEDLAQEAFVAAYRALPQLQKGRPFYPWLRGILLNRCRTYLRGRRRAAARRKAAAERPDHWTHGLSAKSLQERRRAAELVRKGLAGLSSDDREILTLKHIEGLTYDELAATLGIGRGTVASRLYRARQRMREALAELDPTLVEAETSNSDPDREEEE